MGRNYNEYIEPTPGFESVVDIRSDRRAEFWRSYTVNDDIVKAVGTIAKSLSTDSPIEDAKHFFMKGTFGTGKTYSAIVIKHLLEDKYDIVENFLTKNSAFSEVRENFLRARKRGRYYVKFRSGECQQLDTSDKFLIQIERSIRDILKENDFEYAGKDALIGAVKNKVNEFKSTLSDTFKDKRYLQCNNYSNFDEFYELVMNSDSDACNDALDIMQNMHIGLITDFETFSNWIKDVYEYEGNSQLKKTGMFIIWDEFTEYIRKNDNDIIQQLSTLSKYVPFFVIYVIHEYPGFFSDNINAVLSKADARFHKIDISLSEGTTLKLIGECITTHNGKKDKWDEICSELHSSIRDSLVSIIGGPDLENNVAKLMKIYPIHPMTVNLVTKVANLAASNRSIFEFMKSGNEYGFKAYINNNGLDSWKWVTPDYLWDYYFVNNYGGKKNLSRMAEDALNHYNNYKPNIDSDRALRVFKVAMLLIATVDSGNRLRKSKSSSGIQVNEETVCNCFSGMLKKEEVSDYLKYLSSETLKALVLAPDNHAGGFRIGLPFSESATRVEITDEVERLRKNDTPAKLFNKNSAFGSELLSRFIPLKDDPVVLKRLTCCDTCWGITSEINRKLDDLKRDVYKTYHQFGLLIIAIPDKKDLDHIKAIVKDQLNSDDNKRLLVCIMTHPLSESELNNWYEQSATNIVYQRKGQLIERGSDRNDTNELISKWVATAIGKEMYLLYENTCLKIYSNYDFNSKYEIYVKNVYPYAPENVFTKITQYKTGSRLPARFGVCKYTADKDSTNEDQKTFNGQWSDCVGKLKDDSDNVWDCKSVDEIIAMRETPIGRIMAALCKLLDDELKSGNVSLSALWGKLCKELGYYNTGICCYLIGFAFHFYVGKFIWSDEGNNSYKLDEKHIEELIFKMVKGEDGRISSESKIEKRFKEITQKIFDLRKEEAGNIFDCRKSVKVQISENGYPIWAIKYYNDEEYGQNKPKISNIVDKYVEFIQGDSNQSAVVEEILDLMQENAQFNIEYLNNLLKDQNKLNIGMKNFIFKESPEIEDVCDKYDFSMKTLYAVLGKLLQQEKWLWKEQDILDKVNKLKLDLIYIGVVKNTLGESAESVKRVTEIIFQHLNWMRIPGCVYASLQYDWVKTVATLHDLSVENNWASYDDDKKIAIIDELEQYLPIVIDNLNNPLNTLKTYIETNKIASSLSYDEYNEILIELPEEPFNQSEKSFKSNILKKTKDLAYIKQVNKLLNIWNEKTGLKDISAWTTKHRMPIEWVKSDCVDIFDVISALEKKERIDENRLGDAIKAIVNTDFSVLSDKHEIDRHFIINVASEKYVNILLPHVYDLKAKIQENGYRNYKNWNNDLSKIRPIVEEYMTTDLKSEVSGKAKERVKDINDLEQLKKEFERILDNSSEACILLLNEK